MTRFERRALLLKLKATPAFAINERDVHTLDTIRKGTIAAINNVPIGNRREHMGGESYTPLGIKLESGIEWATPEASYQPTPCNGLVAPDLVRQMLAGACKGMLRHIDRLQTRQLVARTRAKQRRVGDSL